MKNELSPAEEAVRKCEERHRTLLRASMDGFWIVDLEGRLLEVNDAYCRMSGYSEPELLNMIASDLEAVDSKDQTAAHIAGIVTRGEERFEIRHRCKNGGIIDVEVSGRYCTIEVGRIILFLRDITGLRQAEKERGQFFKFFQTSADLMCIADPAGSFIKTNPAFTETLGYSEAELVSKPIIEFIHPEDRKTSLKELAQQLQTGITLDFQNRYLCRDGSVKWLSWRVTYNRDEGIAYGTARDITDIKRAEEVLSESEKRMSLAMQAGNMGLFDLNVKTGEAVVNSEYSQMLGYDPADIHVSVSQWIDRLHPDDRERVVSVYYAYVSGEIPCYDVEFRQRTRDGGWKWILSYGRIMERDPDGTPRRMLGVHVNISARKQAEESLRQTEQKLRHIVENSTNLFYMHTTEHILTYVSPQSWKFFDCAPEEAMVLWTDLITDHPHNSAAIESTQRAIDTGERQPPYQVECIGRMGRKIWVEVNEAPIVENGRTVSIVGSLSDITERKQVEESLRESENRLRFALEGSNDGLWDVRMITGKTYLSPRGWEILGYLLDEDGDAINDWSDLVHPEDLPLTNERLRAHIEGRTPIFQVEQRLRTKSGEWKWVHTRGKVVARDAEGTPLRITGTHTDLTEQKVLQEQLGQAQKMESVGRLAGGIAHDFNNMLGVILGYAQLALKKETVTPPLRVQLEQIQMAAERSADIVRQLLAFARKQTVAPKVLDLNETVASMLKMLSRLIGEDIDLAWLPGEELWPVRMDAGQIDQILVNLCVNARDSISSIGRITIETCNNYCDAGFCDMHAGCIPGDYVLLTVSDDGCGMDKETSAKIFEPFFTTKGVGQGTGLGLATVYGIVKQNDGYIDVNTEPGQGTSFKIYLPRHKGKEKNSLTEGPMELAGSGNETVLMVEDEPAILDLGKQILEMLGYRVLTAGTPGEAIRIAISQVGEIHLLLTDVIMPEMNGRDLAKKLLSLYPGLKRLFMSGYTADVIAHHGVLEEGVQFIQKPFSIDTLAAKVREALDQ